MRGLSPVACLMSNHGIETVWATNTDVLPRRGSGTTKGGQNTRYPIPEPELPEPRPEVHEHEIPDHNFG
jgi:hypothetical protein